MPYWRSFAHLIWATKNRLPFVLPYFEDRLYGQLIEKAAELGCYVHAVNGLADHTHVVISIPPKHSVADVVKMLKGSSAHFVNHMVKPDGFHFGWQRGYGYLTLGESQLDRAMDYVQRQKERHRDRQVNRWLEYESALDEGPWDDADSTEPAMLRESGADYFVGDDAWPF
jgi:REP element-mobilizing transposase RayT